jgi:SAM-dependent methyltransferase
MSTGSHWQKVYTGKSPEEQSWHQPRPDLSLEWADKVIDETPARLVDVGGGASAFVDHLLARGGVDVTVIDIAKPALDAAKERLGEQAEQVDWRVADLTEPIDFDQPFDIWHDRAVFHFLTGEDDRRTYLNNLDRNLVADGHAIIATFAPEGPEECSGLPVRRYSGQSLAETLGDSWQLVESRQELHATPWGGEQAFVYTLFERAK